MKKIMILIFSLLIMFSCKHEAPLPGPSAVPYPNGADWSLDIVKFKNPEYKDYILARKQMKIEEIDSIGRQYDKDSIYYAMNNPVLIRSDHELWPSSILRTVWIPIGNDYYLCCWRWKTIFDEENHKGYGTYLYGGFGSRYATYTCCNNIGKDIADNVVLMKDKWDGLPNILPIHLDTMVDTYKTNPWLKKGDTSIYVHSWYDWLYSTNDASNIIMERPLAEHYVVTAKSLFSFTQSPLSTQDKIFLGYEPSNMNPKIHIDLRKTNLLSYPPKEPHYVYVDDDFWAITNPIYDSLFTVIYQKLNSIIESGRFQEYLDYDIDFNQEMCSHFTNR